MDFLVNKCCCPPKPACLTTPDCMFHEYWKCCGFSPVIIEGGIPDCGYSTGSEYCESPPSEQAEYAFISYVFEVAPPPDGGEFYTWNGMVFPGGSGIPTMFSGRVGLPLCPAQYCPPWGWCCSVDYTHTGIAGTGIYEEYGSEEADSWEGRWECVEAWQTWQQINSMSSVSSNASNGGSWIDCCLPAFDNYTLELVGEGQYDWVYSHTTPEQCGSPSVWSRMDGTCNRCVECEYVDGEQVGCAEWEPECGGGAHCPVLGFDYGPEPIQYPCGASCIADVAMNWVVVGELSKVDWSSRCDDGFCGDLCCVNVKHYVTWENMATGQRITRSWNALSHLDLSARHGSCNIKLEKMNYSDRIGPYHNGSSTSHEALPFVVGPKHCRPDVRWGPEEDQVCSMEQWKVMKPLRYCDPCDYSSWCAERGIGDGGSGEDDCYGMGAGEQGDWCGCYYPTVGMCQPAKILSFEIYAT